MKFMIWIVKGLLTWFCYLEVMFARVIKIFTRHDWTTYGEFYEKHKRDSKKVMIKAICNLSGLINDNSGVIDKEYYRELRQQSKKALLRTLCMLQIAYTKKAKPKAVKK